MITVYTSLLKGFDNLRPALVRPWDGVRFLCFTDNPLQLPCPPWEFRPAPQLPHVGRSSRVAKILPHLMLPPDTDYSIWHDANFDLVADPREMVGQMLRFRDWAAYHHPARDCVYKEAALLLKEKIGTPELIQAEVDRYREAGHPDLQGLWANGLIVRRHNRHTAELNELWWELYSQGCERDQLSFPVARKRLGVEINTLPGDIYHHAEHVKFRWHAAFRTNGDNAAFWPERDRMRARIEKLRQVTGIAIPFHPY